MRRIRSEKSKWLVTGINILAIITAGVFFIYPDQIRASWEDDEPPPNGCAVLCEEDVSAVCDIDEDCDGDGWDNAYECARGWDPCDRGDPVPEDCEINSSIDIDYHIDKPSEHSDSYAISFYVVASSAFLKCVGYSEYETSEMSHDVRWDEGPDFKFELSLDASPEEVTAKATVIIDTERGEIEGASASMPVDIHNLIQGYWDEAEADQLDQDDIEDAFNSQEQDDAGWK